VHVVLCELYGPRRFDDGGGNLKEYCSPGTDDFITKFDVGVSQNKIRKVLDRFSSSTKDTFKKFNAFTRPINRSGRPFCYTRNAHFFG